MQKKVSHFRLHWSQIEFYIQAVDVCVGRDSVIVRNCIYTSVRLCVCVCVCVMVTVMCVCSVCVCVLYVCVIAWSNSNFLITTCLRRGSHYGVTRRQVCIVSSNRISTMIATVHTHTQLLHSHTNAHTHTLSHTRLYAPIDPHVCVCVNTPNMTRKWRWQTAPAAMRGMNWKNVIRRVSTLHCIGERAERSLMRGRFIVAAQCQKSIRSHGYP